MVQTTSALMVALIVFLTVGAATPGATVAPEPRLGMTRAEALFMFGPPAEATAWMHGHSWHYRDIRGKLRRDVFQFHGDCAIQVPRAAHAFPRRGVPEAGAYLGQSLPELLERVGRPTAVLRGSITDRLVYEGRKIDVADGRVATIIPD